MRFNLRSHLLQGHVIPALPLALNRARRWDERHQRALVRYYVDAGAGGLAVGVHSTQFAIRDPAIGLYQPVVTLAAETARAALASAKSERTFVLIAGVSGRTPQARREARLARDAAITRRCSVRTNVSRRRKLTKSPASPVRIHGSWTTCSCNATSTAGSPEHCP